MRSILVVAASARSGCQLNARADRIEAALAGSYAVTRVDLAGGWQKVSRALATAIRVGRSQGSDCVISVSDGGLTSLLGYAGRRQGVPWVADLGVGSQWRPRRLPGRLDKLRLARAADMVIVAEETAQDNLYLRLGVAALLVPDELLSEKLPGIVRPIVARPKHPPQMRLLMLGPPNSPHVEHLALAMQERGHLVQVAGSPYDGYPPSVLPAKGVPVRLGGRPRVLWMRRLLHEVQPDVIHAHWLPNALPAKLAGASPLVAMAWGSDVYRATLRERMANRIAVRQADLLITDSVPLLERLVELGAARERTRLVHWGVDLARFSPTDIREKQRLRRVLSLPSGPLILSARGLQDVYNPRTIISAFSLLAAEIADLQLVIKHISTDRPDFGPLPYSERIHFVGHVPHDELRKYYQAADVFVSIPDSDSSPRSVWEAMACGCPVIISDLPWVDDQIIRGQDALVVPIRPREVAGALRRVILDSGLAASMSERGRTLVEQHHNQLFEMDHLEQLYRALAAPDRQSGERQTE